MKIRTSVAAAGTAAVLAGTGTVLFPGVASAHSATHTLKFTAVAPRAAAAPSAGASHAPAIPGAQLWLKRYSGPAQMGAGGTSVAVSPSGGTAFVTGYTRAGTGKSDYATVAYDTATGAQLWVKRYNGPGNGTDEASSVAVSPAGGTVFVTGDSLGATSQNDYATVAYNAATGAQLWVKRYNSHGNGRDYASSVAVSPNGKTVYATGKSTGATTGDDFATVAYSAATGAQQWVRRYTGPGNSNVSAASVAVSPTAGTVFVTGTGMTTIAYSG